MSQNNCPSHEIYFMRCVFLTESLYHLLLDLSTAPAHLSSKQLEVSLTSLACACLLSLVVARGDTSEILGAVAGLLMSPSSLATQMVEVCSHTVNSVCCRQFSDWSNICCGQDWVQLHQIN